MWSASERSRSVMALVWLPRWLPIRPSAALHALAFQVCEELSATVRDGYLGLSDPGLLASVHTDERWQLRPKLRLLTSSVSAQPGSRERLASGAPVDSATFAAAHHGPDRPNGSQTGSPRLKWFGLRTEYR
jgi:hypothetical protein